MSCDDGTRERRLTRLVSDPGPVSRDRQSGHPTVMTSSPLKSLTFDFRRRPGTSDKESQKSDTEGTLVKRGGRSWGGHPDRQWESGPGSGTGSGREFT